MLVQRLLTAAVGIPVIVGLILLGGPAYDIVVAAILAIAALELCAMWRAEEAHNRPLWAVRSVELVAPLSTVLMVVAMVTADEGNDFTASAAGFVVVLLVAAMIRGKLAFRSADSLGVAALAMIYVGYLGAHFVPLRNLDGDGKWVFLAILGTWATDTFAYAIGRLIGRRKIAPTISPGKTLEGTAAGLLGGWASVIVIAEVLDLPMSLGEAALLGTILPAAAVLGDLVESFIKRSAGVKDTSELVPGHGGFLDRLDSLLFTVPLVYYFAIWVVF
ncbi:MAG: CDP-archaeol synthase [Dehalococcoidia bacterium]